MNSAPGIKMQTNFQAVQNQDANNKNSDETTTILTKMLIIHDYAT